jgi:hypothetical protein
MHASATSALPAMVSTVLRATSYAAAALGVVTLLREIASRRIEDEQRDAEAEAQRQAEARKTLERAWRAHEENAREAQERARQAHEEDTTLLVACADAIEDHIRTCPQFDSSNPTSCALPIFTVSLQKHIDPRLLKRNDLRAHHEPYDLVEIIELHSDGPCSRFILDKPTQTVRARQLTPYQGDDWQYGSFWCSCGHAWESAGSRANASQVCDRCEARAVYPDRQRDHTSTERNALIAARQLERKVLAACADAMDEHIRTRRKFDSSDPSSYACAVPTPLLEEVVDPRLFRRDYLRAHTEPYTIMEIIKLHSQGPDSRFIIDRSAQTIRVRQLTPYQGDKSVRQFGEFKCSACSREWKSAGSWRDKWQACKGRNGKECDTIAYPYRQRPLMHDGSAIDDGEKRPHDMTRCEKCIEKGSLCMPHRYYAS